MKTLRKIDVPLDTEPATRYPSGHCRQEVQHQGKQVQVEQSGKRQSSLP
jgi:hypothetical protein